MSTFTRSQWCSALLTALGNPSPSLSLLGWLMDWTAVETAVPPGAAYNLLNTERVTPDVTGDFNSAGVKNYASFAAGIEANRQALTNGLYGEIVRCLQQNDVQGLGSATVFAELNTWCGGCDYGQTIWKYGNANDDTFIIKDVPIMHWYDYPVSVPFMQGDIQYGGAHDIDVGCPPNTPVTAILPGTIVSLTSPSWGKAIGIQLDTPFNGIPFYGYLHLSAIAPTLSVDAKIATGDLLGWSGGCTEASQYAGTSNPTGQNFLNDPSQSSQPQVGIYLARGPIYGEGLGWTPEPDPALDPTPLLALAKKGTITPMQLFTPDSAEFAANFAALDDHHWRCLHGAGYVVHDGILAYYQQLSLDGQKLPVIGLPRSNEIYTKINGQNWVFQAYDNGAIVFPPSGVAALLSVTDALFLQNYPGIASINPAILATIEKDVTTINQGWLDIQAQIGKL